MNTQRECVLPQSAWTVQSSLEGEEELHRSERDRERERERVQTHTHIHAHAHTHYMAHLRAASHKDKLG